MQQEDEGNSSNRNASMPLSNENEEDRSESSRSAEDSKTNDRCLQTEASVAQDVPASISRAERYALWTMIATVVLGVGTLALAGATFDLAVSTRGLRDFAELQAHDMKLALDASNRQAKAAEEANDISRSPLLTVAAVSMADPVANANYTASVTFTNVGHAPAFGVKTTMRLQVSSAKSSIPPDLPLCDACGSGAVIFPFSGFTGSGLTNTQIIDAAQMTAEAVAKVASREMIILLQGRVDYREANGNSHKIELCEMYNPLAHSSAPCLSGNMAD